MTKLNHYKDVEVLFKKGRRIRQFPVQLIYVESSKLVWGVSVRKKDVKLAVQRNKIKRVLRVLTKKHFVKHFEKNSINYIFLVVFLGKNILSFEEMNNVFIELKKRFLN